MESPEEVKEINNINSHSSKSNSESEEPRLQDGEENFELTDEFEIYQKHVEIDTIENHVKAWAFLETHAVFIPERENCKPPTLIE